MKVAKNLGILYKLKYFLDSSVLKNLCLTLVLPYLTYCCEIWGNTYKSTINNLYLLQKKAVRIVAKADYLSHTLPLFQKLSVLNIYDLIELKTILIMYNVYHKNIPVSILNYFTLTSEVHTHSTRQHLDFCIKYRRTTLKFMYLSCCGV